MKQNQKITINTTNNDLEKVIKSVEADIIKLRNMLSDKQKLLETLKNVQEEVNKN